MKSKSNPRQGPARVWWQWTLTGLQICLAYLLVLGLVAFVGFFFLAGKTDSQMALGLGIIVYLSFLLWLPLLFFLLDRHFGRKFSVGSFISRLDLGRPAWKDIGWGLIIVLATLQLIGLLALTLDWLGLVDAEQKQVALELVPGGGWGLFWFFVAGGLLAPIVEEILFRRWIFRPADKRFGLWLAVGISSLLFGLIHFEATAPGAVVWTTILGVALALTYRWTGSLWVAIIMHMTVNILAIASQALGY